MSIWQRLCHRLFGWHYVAFELGYNCYVERVRVLPNGDVCVRFIGVRYLLPDGTMVDVDGDTRKYKPLTWRLQDGPSSQLRVVKK